MRKGNDIVECSGCKKRWHQRCHHTPIVREHLNPDEDWFCVDCVETEGSARAALKVTQSRIFPNLDAAIYGGLPSSVREPARLEKESGLKGERTDTLRADTTGPERSISSPEATHHSRTALTTAAHRFMQSDEYESDDGLNDTIAAAGDSTVVSNDTLVDVGAMADEHAASDLGQSIPFKENPRRTTQREVAQSFRAIVRLLVEDPRFASGMRTIWNWIGEVLEAENDS